MKSPPQGLLDNGPFQYVDVLEKTQLNRLIVEENCNTVIHLAAILSAAGEKYPDLALKINNEGTQNVLELARTNKMKVSGYGCGSCVCVCVCVCVHVYVDV